MPSRAAPTSAMPSFDADVEFVLLAEAGVLERQALLACESLRTFGGALRSSAITVVSPRPAQRPSRESIAGLERMQVQYVPADIGNPTPQLGESYKAFAVAHIESRPGPRTLIQVDSDTVFVAEPAALARNVSATARPVDAAGLCTTGPGHPLDPYWRALCERFGVDYDRLPFVQTTLGGQRVKANYNGGLVAAAREHGAFQHAAELYRAIAAEGLTPPGRENLTIKTGAGAVGDGAGRYFGLSQIVFSLACAILPLDVAILPPSYNFPVHLLGNYSGPVPTPLVHLHYHWMGELPLDGSPLSSERLGLPADTRAWLRERLPL